MEHFAPELFIHSICTTKFGKVGGKSSVSIPQLEQDFTFEVAGSLKYSMKILITFQPKDIAKGASKDSLLFKVHNFLLTRRPAKCDHIISRLVMNYQHKKHALK